MSAVIEKKFSHVFGGLVWRLVPSGNLLAVETRSEANRSVTFSLLDIQSGTLLWEDIQLEETWWVSLYGVYDDTVLIHHYSDDQVPEYKGLTALSVNNGEEQWERPGITIQGTCEGQLVGTTKEDEAVFFVDTNSGGNAGNLSGQQKAMLRSMEDDSVMFPHQYLEEQAYFEQVKGFLNDRFSIQPVVAIDYLEWNSFIIISYYLYHKEGLQNNLLLMSAEGEVLLDETIGKQLKGVGIDPFFIMNQKLCFIKNKNELFVYEPVV